MQPILSRFSLGDPVWATPSGRPRLGDPVSATPLLRRLSAPDQTHQSGGSYIIALTLVLKKSSKKLQVPETISPPTTQSLLMLYISRRVCRPRQLCGCALSGNVGFSQIFQGATHKSTSVQVFGQRSV